jgi:anti-sigma regulatory factor (Ser/Thr protein kinase)
MYAFCGMVDAMPITFQPSGDVRIASEERLYVRNVHAPHAVRRFVRAILETWGIGHLVDDSEIVASELATNAVQNATGDTLAVRIERTATGICLKVWDDNPEEPTMDCPATDAERGRGLLITAALSQSYGCYRLAAGGKVVWSVINA